MRTGRNTPATQGTHTGGGRGQVLIEVLLILPVFMFLVFSIMEIGYLSFRTILLHHAAYEVARIGSLTANDPSPCGAPGASGQPAINRGKMMMIASQILPGVSASIGYGKSPLRDPQSGCLNYDVEVKLTQEVRLIFPMTGVILSNTGDRQKRVLTASVQMPIERPLFK